MIENAIVGPFVAIISFVCSVGNVPLAAALWQDGISFGGVVAFIFADLISLPLLLIYRKLYGGRLTLRLLGVFWLVMSTAGLLTELIFQAAGLVPATRPASHRARAPELELHHVPQHRLPGRAGRDLLAAPQQGALRRGAGGSPRPGLRHAGREGQPRRRPARRRAHDYFCSEHCRDRFAGCDRDWGGQRWGGQHWGGQRWGSQHWGGSVTWARPVRYAIVTTTAEPCRFPQPSQRHAEHEEPGPPHPRSGRARPGAVAGLMMDGVLLGGGLFLAGCSAASSSSAAARQTAPRRRPRTAATRHPRARQRPRRPRRRPGWPGRYGHHGPAGAGQQHHLHRAADRAGGRRQLGRRPGRPDRRERGRLRRRARPRRPTPITRPRPPPACS